MTEMAGGVVMGSRVLPTECKHGTVLDWGDFGPCQDCDEHDGEPCPNLAVCPQCEAVQTITVTVLPEVS